MHPIGSWLFFQPFCFMAYSMPRLSVVFSSVSRTSENHSQTEEVCIVIYMNAGNTERQNDVLSHSWLDFYSYRSLDFFYNSKSVELSSIRICDALVVLGSACKVHSRYLTKPVLWKKGRNLAWIFHFSLRCTTALHISRDIALAC